MIWKKAMVEDGPVKSFFVDAANYLKFWQSRRAGSPNYDMLA